MKKQLIILAIIASLSPYTRAQTLFAARFASTSTAWTPAGLSPDVWLDASDAATVLDALGSVATNGAPVQTWHDKSGNSRHATSTAELQRPTMAESAQNGLNAVRSNGSSQMALASAGGLFRNKSDAYIFAVSKDAVRTAGDSTHTIIYASTPTVGVIRIGLLSRLSGNNIAVGARRLDTDGFVSVTTTSADGYHLYAVRGDWGAGYMRLSVDCGAFTSAALSSAGATSDTDAVNTSIFRVNSGSEMPSGSDICEIIIVSRSMTASEITLTCDYLKNKWGTP